MISRPFIVTFFVYLCLFTLMLPLHIMRSRVDLPIPSILATSTFL